MEPASVQTTVVTETNAALASYVPALTLRRFAVDPRPLTEPEVERFPAAVLFADIKGFTALAERAADRGPAGTEDLAALLNAYFAPLFALVEDHGGDIVKLAGDSLIALWPGGDAPHEDSTRLTLRAAHCALIIQGRLDNFPAEDAEPISLRIGVAFGEVVVMHVGGVRGQWESLVTGDPVGQAVAAEQAARPGEVVLSRDAWALVHEQCRAAPLAAGAARLEGIEAPVAPRPAPRPREAAPAVAAFVPATVRMRIAAGQTGWMGELRRVTAVFVNLPDLDPRAPDALARTQAVMQTLQTALYRYEGSINKLTVDEKGSMMLAVMGLPPFAHEDDTVRGARAAQEMQAGLRALGARSAVGVATGRVFCGAVGGEDRREYTMNGDVIALAARLMQAAGDGVLCDEATYLAARSRLTFEALPPITVKGRRGPVAVFGPRGDIAPTGAGGPLIGREAERALLDGRLDDLRAGRGGLVVIEGEAGLGKSCLIADFQGRATAQGVRVLCGAGDAIEMGTPYFAWRAPFSHLLGLQTLTDPEARRRAVRERLEAEPEWERMAPLLNAVLPLDLPENDVTVQMSGQVRTDSLHDLMLHVLQAAAAQAPTALVLEDAHWLDASSWTLALLVSRRVRPTLLALTTRPGDDGGQEDRRQLLAAPDAVRLSLPALSADDTGALLAARLGAVVVDASVGALIYDKAQGNPFFTEELALALRGAGTLVVTEGRCRLAPGGDSAVVKFPETVQGAITSRLDRLAPPQQMALKVASIIGPVFSVELLRDIHPIPSDWACLTDLLQSLTGTDITPVDAPGPAFAFKHALIQEVAYDLMLFAQRRQLHRAVAEWHERRHAEDLSPFYSLLAHHWGGAADTGKAVEYLDKAGEQALRGGSYREAAAFLGQVLTLPASADSPRRARWEQQLGEAHLGLGRGAQSREHFERAVALLGHPVPAAPWRLAASLLRQVGRQALYRAFPGRIPACGPGAREAALQGARAYERLGEIHYMANQPLPLIHALLHSGNLAETGGLSPELARAYANLCIAASLAPAHGAARAYARRAQDVAAQAGHLPTLAWVLELTGIYNVGVGRWDAARGDLERAVAINGRLNDRAHREECLAMLGEAYHHRGEFARCAALYAEVQASAEDSRNPLALAWGLIGRAQETLILGDVDEAVRLLDATAAAASAVTEEETELPNRMLRHGFMARVHLHRGDSDAALAEAAKAMEIMARMPPVYVAAIEGYASVAEVYLTVWEATRREGRAAAGARREARRACRILGRVARVFPIAKPRALLLRGLADALAGCRGRAQAAWRAGLRHAERLSMPFEQGLAHYEIGRHLPAGDPARRRHLALACEAFGRLGTSRHGARAEAALARPAFQPPAPSAPR